MNTATKKRTSARDVIRIAGVEIHVQVDGGLIEVDHGSVVQAAQALALAWGGDARDHLFAADWHLNELFVNHGFTYRGQNSDTGLWTEVWADAAAGAPAAVLTRLAAHRRAQGWLIVVG